MSMKSLTFTPKGGGKSPSPSGLGESLPPSRIRWKRQCAAGEDAAPSASLGSHALGKDAAMS